MTTLWHARVESIDDRVLTLAVRSVHADAGAFDDGAAFALRLLHLPALKLGRDGYVPTGPLGAAVSEGDVHDEDWVARNAERFVASVAIDTDSDDASRARYRIEVTDARWLEHLRAGQAWRSAAYA